VEIFNIAYGVYVSKLLREANNNDPEEVNKELEELGYKMGLRLVDDFFSRVQTITPCRNFATSMDVITKQAFKMFLGVNATTSHWNQEMTECNIVFKDNPLGDFVVLPPNY
jgi:hypothetical protein